MRHDPRLEEHFSEEVRECLSKHQRFEYLGALLELREVRPRREPHGATTYVAVFDVLEEDPQREWILGPVYCESEYLVATAISNGLMEHVPDTDTSGDSASVHRHRQCNLSEAF